jgi:hypothetical protein
MARPSVWPSAEATPASSPALALQASLSASGLLRHASALDGVGVGTWSAAQAVHQGDRLLRTARSLLSAHARACGDHASLWAADGPDLVAVLVEQGNDGLLQPGVEIGPGRRLTIGPEASRLLARVSSSCGTQAAVDPDRRAWTALMKLAMGIGTGGDGHAGLCLEASVWPWRPWPLVLVTIDRTPAAAAQGDTQTRPGHAQRHSSLGLCLAWGLDAVAK